MGAGKATDQLPVAQPTFANVPARVLYGGVAIDVGQ